ncbi:MAG: hypothetical protein HYY04_02615 [Chloroflexi bacterium]|nr:hypothetical protein [Chloroflexota bacterium]
MAALIDLLKVIHVVNAMLMIWPFYALVAVNQRGRLGPPVGDRTDTYLENIVKNRTVPCFIFQATALVSGLALVLLPGHGLGALVTNPALGLKVLLLVFIMGLLSYVHTGLQPRIDAQFARGNGKPLPPDAAKSAGALRLRRKRLASVCLFCVLTVSMLGVQTWRPFSLELTIALVLAIAAFTWRGYKSVTPYGWM